MTNPLVALATYLTDSRRVTRHSVELQMGGERAAEAKEFFELHALFNIRGYATSGEALVAIQDTIANDVLKA